MVKKPTRVVMKKPGFLREVTRRVCNVRFLLHPSHHQHHYSTDVITLCSSMEPHAHCEELIAWRPRQRRIASGGKGLHRASCNYPPGHRRHEVSTCTPYHGIAVSDRPGHYALRGRADLEWKKGRREGVPGRHQPHGPRHDGGHQVDTARDRGSRERPHARQGTAEPLSGQVYPAPQRQTL